MSSSQNSERLASSKEYYTIKTSHSNYIAMVEHMSEDMDKIHIGNTKKCVVMSVYFDGDEPNIDAISHDQNCNVTRDMLQNTGTVHMIKSAMSFVHKHYPQYKFKNFQLKDKSSIKCQRGWMPLNIYYLAKHGKTWYEKKLGAQPVDYKNVYYNDKKRLRKDMNTKIEQRELLYDSLMTNANKAKKDALYPYYENKKTIKEFLDYLFDNYDCYIFRNWLESYVKNFIPYILGMYWHVTHDTNFHVEIEKLHERPKDLFSVSGGMIDAGYFFL